MGSIDLKIGTVALAASLMLGLPDGGLAQDPYLVGLLPAPPEATLSAAQENAVTSTLNATQQRELTGIGQALSRDPSSSRVRGRWEALITETKEREVDIGALWAWVFRQAYLEQLEDLAMYAEKVKAFNDAKESIRDELTRVREYSRSSRTSRAPYYPDATVWRPSRQTQRPPASIDSSAELDSYIEALEERLATVGDDAQLANIDLQQMLEKAQQTLQLISNVSKRNHDTAMAIIRKVG